jgi:NADPH-dependent 2,4-dienoyl-CoA reductase/sulfur reductase-like enzyme
LAGKNLRAAGFDGVEIMGAGGLLVHQFLSPALNFRQDRYGSSLEGRLRFPLEIVVAVREAIGWDMVLGFKMAGDDFYDGGIELEDAKKIALALEGTGMVDYLTVAAGMYVSVPTHVPPMYYPLGCFAYLASEIRRTVKKVNVNCMGRVNDPTQGENIIAEGHADMLGMVRALICDPEFVRKTREDRVEEIRQCVGCEEGCYARFRRGLPITCAYNPEAGREKELPIVAASTKRKVMVVGGGVAGLEMARVAALRGHEVHLYEKSDQLGGQLIAAAKAPCRDDFEQMPRYYSYQMELLEVKVSLGIEATHETVREICPDVIVVATGSRPRSLEVPGKDCSKVVDPEGVLLGRVEVGEKVVVVAGEHGMEALCTADFLAERGKDVEVLTEFFHAGAEAPFGILQAVYRRLFRKGVPIRTLTAIKELRGRTVVTRDVFSGAESSIEDVDTVVAATGRDPVDVLYHSLKAEGREVYAVGDCLQPRLIPQVTLEAARLAREV